MSSSSRLIGGCNWRRSKKWREYFFMHRRMYVFSMLKKEQRAGNDACDINAKEKNTDPTLNIEQGKENSESENPIQNVENDNADQEDGVVDDSSVE
jgi:hypothetical protein